MIDVYYCKDCGEIAEPEGGCDRVSTSLVTQRYGDPYPICSACGSDRIEDIADLADRARDLAKDRKLQEV